MLSEAPSSFGRGIVVGIGGLALISGPGFAMPAIIWSTAVKIAAARICTLAWRELLGLKVFAPIRVAAHGILPRAR